MRGGREREKKKEIDRETERERVQIGTRVGRRKKECTEGVYGKKIEYTRKH